MILVTGATGFIGQTVTQALEYRGLKYIPFTGRLSQRNRLREQLVGVETVIHLASAESTGRNRQLERVDIEGTKNLVEEAERVGVNHIVYVSRIGADYSSLFPTLRTKGRAEEIIRNSEVPSTILRSATVFGRGDRFLNTIRTLAAWNWPFVFLPAGGNSLLQVIWVEDLVRCILAVSDPLDLKGYRGNTYAITGEERFRYRELVHIVLETAGLSRRPYSIQMQLIRTITWLFFGWQQKPLLTLYFLDRLNNSEVADLDTVYRQFGFHPARIRDQISYLRRRGRIRNRLSQ